MLERFQDKKQEEQFRDFINYLLGKDKFTLLDFRQFVSDTIYKQKKGLYAKLMNTETEQEREFIQYKKVLDCLTEDELITKNEFNADLKNDIEAITAVTPDGVNKMLMQYRQLREMQIFLKKIEKEGKELPADYVSLNVRFERFLKNKRIDKSMKTQMQMEKMRESEMKKRTQEAIEQKRRLKSRKLRGINY